MNKGGHTPPPGLFSLRILVIVPICPFNLVEDLHRFDDADLHPPDDTSDLYKRFGTGAG
jgi:hypothetical protein